MGGCKSSRIEEMDNACEEKRGGPGIVAMVPWLRRERIGQSRQSRATADVACQVSRSRCRRSVERRKGRPCVCVCKLREAARDAPTWKLDKTQSTRRNTR